MRLAVILPYQADIGVAGVKLQPDRRHLLGADQKHVFAVERKEIGAFPHPPVLVVAGCKHAYIFPVERVLALIKQDSPAAVRAAVPDNGIEHIAFPPDLRIAEIVFAASLGQKPRADHRIALELLIVCAVADRYTLGLERIYLTVSAPNVPDAGIHQKLSSVRKFNGAAGKAAVAVIIRIGRESGRKPFPADEILCFHMSPVHRTPLRIIGVVLEKQMIFALIRRKAVGVIDPTDTACQMEQRLF